MTHPDRPTKSSRRRRRAVLLASGVAVASAGIVASSPATVEARPPAECSNRTISSWHTWVSPLVLGPLRRPQRHPHRPGRRRQDRPRSARRARRARSVPRAQPVGGDGADRPRRPRPPARSDGRQTVDHEPPVVRTAHPLYGDTVRADLGRLRERELAAACSPRHRSRPIPTPGSDGPTWPGGPAPPTPRFLTDGAFAALGVFDFDRAHALASEALRLDAVSATGLADHGGTRLVRAATVLAAIGRYDDAVGLFDPQPTDTTDVRWAVQRATTLFMRDRHGDRARDALRASPVSDRHNELAATQVWIELFDGALPAAAAAADAVFDDPASSPTALVWAAIAGAAAGALGADTSTGPAMLLTARASLERVHDDSPFAPLQVDLADWLVRLTTLDVADAVSTAERHSADAVESGSPIRVGAWAGFAGWAALESGQLVLAEGRLLESSTLTAAVDPFGLTAFADAVLAAGHGRQRDRSAAARRRRRGRRPRRRRPVAGPHRRGRRHPGRTHAAALPRPRPGQCAHRPGAGDRPARRAAPLEPRHRRPVRRVRPHRSTTTSAGSRPSSASPTGRRWPTCTGGDQAPVAAVANRWTTIGRGRAARGRHDRSGADPRQQLSRSAPETGRCSTPSEHHGFGHAAMPAVEDFAGPHGGTSIG